MSPVIQGSGVEGYPDSPVSGKGFCLCKVVFCYDSGKGYRPICKHEINEKKNLAVTIHDILLVSALKKARGIF